MEYPINKMPDQDSAKNQVNSSDDVQKNIQTSQKSSADSGEAKFYQRIQKMPQSIYPILSSIDQLKGQWQGGTGLSPQILNRLRQSALITSAGASTRIEGSVMTDDEVRSLMQGLNITKMRDRDREEVQGYIDASNFIQENFANINLSENHFKQIHQILLGHSSKDYSHRGEYKHLPNDVVARDASGQEVGVVFRTLTPFETPLAMSSLVNWLNDVFSRQDIHPLIIIGSFVVEFLRIHPFVDGNGRMSRLLTDLLMLKSGFTYTPYVSLEKIIEDTKTDYYLALRSSQATFDTADENINDWIQYFLQICETQARSAAAIISHDNMETLLSATQYKVYEKATQLGEFAVRDLEFLLDVPRPTIRQALEKLEGMGVIESLGAGRGARYRMIPK